VAYRPDLVVERTVVVELKSVERFSAVHTAQLLTYLHLEGLHVGLLLNFNSVVLARGIKRVVL
jgi:GxxExxY protein